MTNHDALHILNELKGTLIRHAQADASVVDKTPIGDMAAIQFHTGRQRAFERAIAETDLWIKFINGKTDPQSLRHREAEGYKRATLYYDSL